MRVVHSTRSRLAASTRVSGRHSAPERQTEVERESFGRSRERRDVLGRIGEGDTLSVVTCSIAFPVCSNGAAGERERERERERDLQKDRGQMKEKRE